MQIKTEDIKGGYRVAAVVGMAMALSVFIYAVVVELIKRSNAPFSGFAPFPEVDSLRYVLVLVAAGQYFLIRFVRDKILSAKTGSIQEGQSSALLGRLFASSIVTFALCETPAIFGLVLFFIAGSSTDFYAFAAISLIYFGIYFPRQSEWEEWLKGQGVVLV